MRYVLDASIGIKWVMNEVDSLMGEMTSGNEETVAHGLSAIAREQESYPPAGYAWYVVGVLTLAYIFSFIDRQILSLMVGPIQQDLRISDTQMSLLMGLTFAVFYTFFGIPLGRLADTSSRRLLIAVGVAAWSVMTAGCGLAMTFWQLAVFRMGVGVGEATLSPSAYSLICLNLGIGMVALYGYGATSWVPSLFIRRYDWTPRQTGLVFGLDVFRDKKAVHLSLLVVGAFAFAFAAILLWFGLRSYRGSLDYQRRWSETNA